jgi:hypothetical protein
MTAKHQAVPPETVFNVVASGHGCNFFTFRWQFHLSSPPPLCTAGATIAGIDLVFMKPGTFQYQKAYSEFDNIHLIYEFGTLIGGLPSCGAKPPL